MITRNNLPHIQKLIENERAAHPECRFELSGPRYVTLEMRYIQADDIVIDIIDGEALLEQYSIQTYMKCAGCGKWIYRAYVEEMPYCEDCNRRLQRDIDKASEANERSARQGMAWIELAE
jgi:hypothetical protein